MRGSCHNPVAVWEAEMTVINRVAGAGLMTIVCGYAQSTDQGLERFRASFICLDKYILFEVYKESGICV